jgi:hypothetical protein
VRPVTPLGQPTSEDVRALAQEALPAHPAWADGTVWWCIDTALVPDRSASFGIRREDLRREGAALVLEATAHGPDWVDVRVLDAGSDIVLALMVSSRSGPPRNRHGHVLNGALTGRTVRIVDGPGLDSVSPATP